MLVCTLGGIEYAAFLIHDYIEPLESHDEEDGALGSGGSSGRLAFPRTGCGRSREVRFPGPSKKAKRCRTSLRKLNPAPPEQAAEGVCGGRGVCRLICRVGMIQGNSRSRSPSRRANPNFGGTLDGLLPANCERKGPEPKPTGRAAPCCYFALVEVEGRGCAPSDCDTGLLGGYAR